MATAIRSKENTCDFSLFKTPIRNSMSSSTRKNDLGFYSNNLKHLNLTSMTSMNDSQMYNSTVTTPIRLNKTKFSTPGSAQRRRALALVSSNSKQTSHLSSSDDSSTLSNLKELNNKHDEPVILQAPSPTSEDDLPHHHSSHTHHYEDTFDDLIPADERVEHMVTNQTNGINIFAFYGGIDNTIRYQSPQCSRINVSTLLDILT